MVPPPRFKAPPGSEFLIGSTEDGERPVFAIWAPGAKCLVGPDGAKTGWPFMAREVSESEFWAAVPRSERRDSPSAKVPPGTEFWIGANSDGETRPHALVRGPKGGWKAKDPAGESWPAAWEFMGRKVEPAEWDVAVFDYWAESKRQDQ